MNSLLLLFFASTFSATPVQRLTDTETSGISYVCYVEAGELMLATVQQDVSQQVRKYVHTGISTNSFENVTMELKEGELCMTVSYADAPSVQAHFDRSSLELSQILLKEPMPIADSGVTEE